MGEEASWRILKDGGTSPLSYANRLKLDQSYLDNWILVVLFGQGF